MSTKTIIIKSEDTIEALPALLTGRKMPFTVKIIDGEPRSLAQNRLYHKWIGELAKQIQGHTTVDVEAYLKLHFGVPILRSQDADYKEFYDRCVKPRDYEIKLEMMKPPYGFPVSSEMTTKQMTEYLDKIHSESIKSGFQLTEPEKNN